MKAVVLPPSRIASPRPGFTLIELLVVMAIISVILALSVPVVGSVLRSNRLNIAAQAVVGQLDLARQAALTSNQAVEVRFYQLADPTRPGTSALRGMQAFKIGAPATGTTPTYTPVGKAVLLPAGIVFSNDPITASTLLNVSTSGGFGITPLTTTGDSLHPLPPPDGAAPYFSFRFRPTGQTDLTPATSSANGKPLSPLLTLYPEDIPKVANGLPANFISIQIDVINGTLRTYQP